MDARESELVGLMARSKWQDGRLQRGLPQLDSAASLRRTLPSIVTYDASPALSITTVREEGKVLATHRKAVSVEMVGPHFHFVNLSLFVVAVGV